MKNYGPWYSPNAEKLHIKLDTQPAFFTFWSEHRAAPGNVSELHILLGGQRPGRYLLLRGSDLLNLLPARQSVVAKGADHVLVGDLDPVLLAEAWWPHWAAAQCTAGGLLPVPQR